MLVGLLARCVVVIWLFGLNVACDGGLVGWRGSWQFCTRRWCIRTLAGESAGTGGGVPADSVRDRWVCEYVLDGGNITSCLGVWSLRWRRVGGGEKWEYFIGFRMMRGEPTPVFALQPAEVWVQEVDYTIALAGQMLLAGCGGVVGFVGAVGRRNIVGYGCTRGCSK